jgi:hypothetical protein
MLPLSGVRNKCSNDQLHLIGPGAFFVADKFGLKASSSTVPLADDEEEWTIICWPLLTGEAPTLSYGQTKGRMTGNRRRLSLPTDATDAGP